ncbi:kinesin-like protein KIFC3 isoform X3 [Ptychodera flava]|uniref:kinesin-like protein KIFC3 isoform X3 n=1 Tax=Ptychodera flava TaxID=63121 RepID=UPI003969FA4C
MAHRISKEPVFKTPMTFSPRLDGQRARPSPSRHEMLMEELGLNDMSDGEESLSSCEDETELDQMSRHGVSSLVEFQAMKRELDERNKQREDLMFRIKMLTDNNKQYKTRLTKEETSKKQQIRIMRKTHEAHLDEKRELIKSLQDIIEEQESKIFDLEAELKGVKTSPKHQKGSTGIQKMVESIERLHVEKAQFTEQLLKAENKLEVSKVEWDETIHDLYTQLEVMTKNYEEAKTEIHKMKSYQGVTDHEKQVEKLEKINAQLQEELDKTNSQLHNDVSNGIDEKQLADSAEIQKLQEENTFLQEDNSKLQEDLISLENDVTILNKRLSDKDVHFKSSEKKANTEIKSLKVKLRQVEMELAELKANPKIVEVTKTVSVESEESKQALSESHSENTQLRSHIDRLQKQKEDAQRKWKSAQQRIQSLENKLSENESEMEIVKEEFEHDLIKLEASKQEAIQELKLDAQQNNEMLNRRLSLMRVRFSQIRPGLLDIAEEYKNLRKICSQFPKIIRATIQHTKNEIQQAISGVSEHNKELVRKYKKEMQLRKKYHNELVELKGNIRVFCRVRPPIKEDGAGLMARVVVTCDEDDDGIVFVTSKGRTNSYEVDKVFSPSSSQEEVFEECKHLVVSCIDGYNVCIFAYGQTGSGKTYTMEGPADDLGINQRALQLLFDEREDREKEWDYVITVSIMEIYNEMLRDLLSNDPTYKMDIKMNQDGGLYVPGLTCHEVETVDEVNQVLNLAKVNRATASTNMNEHSSRSHALLCVTVKGMNRTTGSRTIGRLNLVDLAGSERVSKSGADGARLKEAQNINKSLSSLGDVIHALRNKQGHIPYRNSKLTYLLQDSLGGDSKTLMVVQVSPVEKNCGETSSSLSFAQRVRTVELGQASKKMESSEIAMLKGRLAQYELPPIDEQSEITSGCVSCQLQFTCQEQ